MLFLWFKGLNKLKKEAISMRRKLRDRVRTLYRTQDKCAYELGINNGTLSRIINCTQDPTDAQLEELCNDLNMTKKELNEKDE